MLLPTVHIVVRYSPLVFAVVDLARNNTYYGLRRRKAENIIGHRGHSFSPLSTQYSYRIIRRKNKQKWPFVGGGGIKRK